MRRSRALALASATLALGLVVGTTATAATSNDTACRAGLTAPYSHDEIVAYQACRFDKLDAAVTALKPSSTPAPTPSASASPSSSPLPTVRPTSASPSPASSATQPASGDFPSASTTGVPAGVTLKRVPEDVTSGTGWHYEPRGWISVDTNGAVFSGYRTSLNVDVTANNAVVSSNAISCGPDAWGISLRHTTGVKITRNTLTGTSAGQPCGNSIRGIYGDDDAVTITGNDIGNANSAINHLNRGGLINENFIHDLANSPDGLAHLNGVQLGAGTGPKMTIDHNTILNPVEQTDAIMLANDDGAQANRTITNNLLGGGGYTLYGSGGPSGQATGIVVTGNRFTTRYFAQGGQYGPVAYWKPSGAGNVWSDNTWADGPDAGKPINP